MIIIKMKVKINIKIFKKIIACLNDKEKIMQLIKKNYIYYYLFFLL